MYKHVPLADPGRGEPGAPPNGRGPMIFYDRNANFSQFRLRSLLILNIISIEIWQKHTKNEFYFNF